MSEKVELGFDYFDRCETHPNCTVQILENTKTGQVSVGWMDNPEPNPFKVLHDYCEARKADCETCRYREICDLYIPDLFPADWEVNG